MIVFTQYIKVVQSKGDDKFSCEGCHFDLGIDTCGLENSDKLTCSNGEIFELVSECVQQTGDE